MAVIFTAAALSLFYLANLPLKFALVFRTHPQAALSSGASIFEGRFALRRALEKRKKRDLKKAPLSLKRGLPAARYLLRHLQLEQLCIRGTISEPDAAATALICGAASSIHAACLPFGGRVLISLQPDFSASGSEIEIQGMIGVRAGHIMLAALIFALNALKERFRTWITGIRLKVLCKPRWKISAI